MTRLNHTGCNFIDEPVRLGTGSAVERHEVIGAASWKKGATAPTEGFHWNYPYLAFQNARSDEAYYVIHVPHRRKAGTNIVITIRWWYVGAPDAGKVLWKCDYKSSGCGDSPSFDDGQILKLSAGSHTTNQIVCTTLAPEILDANLTEDDDLALHIWRDGNDPLDTLAVEARFMSVHVHFTMDKFGNDI